MTKVVYVDHVARLSGGEIALARLLPVLSNHVDVHVILGEDGPLVGRLNEHGIAVEVLAIDAAARDARKDSMRPTALSPAALATWTSYIVALRRRLRELDADLVHTNSLKAAIYGGLAGRAANVPVIWHVRDRIADDYLPAPAVRMVRAAARILPTAIIANSQTTLDTLPRRVGVASAVAHDSVSSEAVASKTAPRDGGTRPFRVGLVGRLAAWKGQHVFLDAFAEAFADSDAEAWLIGSAMFGEDSYAAELRAQVTRLGLSDRVSFRGFREDVFAELAELDVLVHASVTPEPFGQVVIEGLAAGLPVIATNAGGPAEIITDGIDGVLVAPGSVRQLATALLRLSENSELRASMTAAAVRTAARYTPQRTADQVCAIYDRVLGRRR